MALFYTISISNKDADDDDHAINQAILQKQ